MHLESKLKLEIGQASDQGPKEDNEDCIGIRIGAGDLLSTKGVVSAIADGVTAAEHGRIASETCVQGFISDYFSTPESWEVKKAAQTILNALNQWLYSQGKDFQDERKGYVTTLSILVIKSRQAHIFHIGDSRIHRYRDGHLEQLTRDHSARVSEETCYLTRAMGMHLSLKIDYRVVEVEAGDLFLSTTDGAHEHLSKEEVSDILDQRRDNPNLACETLVAKAVDNGSRDNASCALLRVIDLSETNRCEMVDRLCALPFPPDLNPGMKLEGWKVEEILHASPRSQLYLVRDDNGETAVMKTPSVNYQDDAAYLECFIQEEWIGLRVDNTNIIKFIPRKVKQPGCLYHLWEHVEGKTLAEWIRENHPPHVQDVVDIIAQIIRGVRALHHLDILHQDLKPENIIIHRGGTVKIIDFGSCLVRGIREIETPIRQPNRLGTLHYTAPEYMLGHKPTARADQFSIATIAYHMLTGKYPYGNAFEKAHATRTLRNLRYISTLEHNPMGPLWVDGALRKALSLNPEDRYDTFSELLRDLREPNQKRIDERSAPPIERNPALFWKILAGILAAAQAVTLYYLLK